MLPDERARPRVAGPVGLHPPEEAGQEPGPQVGLLDGVEPAARLQLRRGEHRRGLGDRRRYDACRLELVDRLQPRAAGGPGRDLAVDLLPRAEPSRDARPGVPVPGPLGTAEHHGESRPLAVALRGEGDPSRAPVLALRRVAAVRDGVGGGVPGRGGEAPGERPAPELPGQVPGEGLGVREVDVGAPPRLLAPPERQERCEDDRERGARVGRDGARDLLHLAAAAARERVPGRRLHLRAERDVAGVRAAHPPGRHRDHRDTGIGVAHHLPAEAGALDGAGGEALHQHVGAREQPAEGLGAGRRANVERDVALVAVALDLRRHPLVDGSGAVGDARVGDERARQGSPRERLDLDHVGAHVAEQRGAERAGPHLGEVDDPDAGEGTARHGPPRSRGRPGRPGSRATRARDRPASRTGCRPEGGSPGRARARRRCGRARDRARCSPRG